MTPDENALFAELSAWFGARSERTIETSCAQVFLNGGQAFKIKRPVDYGYLDYSTTEKRRWALERELRFNRLAAPDIYLRVGFVTREADGSLALDGDGEVLEHVLDGPAGDAVVADAVERLLASPRYGERMAVPWLDVVRFGESNGFERNFIIDDLYPFRDYVIKSINDDKPFNQFITEHLAGDVIGKDKPEIEVGSAFLVAGPYDDVGNQDKVAQANIRAATIDDMITATSGAFLGLTINCARCHDHKFDPIPTEDYYRLRAAFEGVTHGRRVVATLEQRSAHAAALKPLNAELKRLQIEREKIDADIEIRAKAAVAKRPRKKMKRMEGVKYSLQLRNLHIIHIRRLVHRQGDHAFRGMSDAFAFELADGLAVDAGLHDIAFDRDEHRVPVFGL